MAAPPQVSARPGAAAVTGQDAASRGGGGDSGADVQIACGNAAAAAAFVPSASTSGASSATSAKGTASVSMLAGDTADNAGAAATTTGPHGNARKSRRAPKLRQPRNARSFRARMGPSRFGSLPPSKLWASPATASFDGRSNRRRRRPTPDVAARPSSHPLLPKARARHSSAGLPTNAATCRQKCGALGRTEPSAFRNMAWWACVHRLAQLSLGSVSPAGCGGVAATTTAVLSTTSVVAATAAGAAGRDGVAVRSTTAQDSGARYPPLSAGRRGLERATVAFQSRGKPARKILATRAGVPRTSESSLHGGPTSSTTLCVRVRTTVGFTARTISQVRHSESAGPSTSQRVPHTMASCCLEPLQPAADPGTICRAHRLKMMRGLCFQLLPMSPHLP
mmetsp:Transcript_39014/g.112050  ORF Transcript_39014/g.112050 Transcript_39014/m.112050 type:complete len:394 (+) Transcript_39014:465-1646(+)